VTTQTILKIMFLTQNIISEDTLELRNNMCKLIQQTVLVHN